MGLPSSIARVEGLTTFHVDPFGTLLRARAEHGDLVVLRDDAPLFSRAEDCAGVVAVFGAVSTRTVLCDIDTFGMPVSAARKLGLPPALVNLTRGLHSLRGDEHASQRRIVASVLAEHTAVREAVRVAVATVSGKWSETIRLMRAMRQVARELGAIVLFGADPERYAGLASLLEAHFYARREASAPGGGDREQLIAIGLAAEETLRAYISDARSDGVVGRLARSGLDPDAIVAHANILFISATEPVAIALTWTLLILTQFPELRAQLHQADSDDPRTVRLDHVIAECLRLLPPNAMMARITTNTAVVAGRTLPPRCEIVLCPFVAHRDGAVFADPDSFQPARWIATKPSPFEYFPFGAGGHACAGRSLAHQLLVATTAELLSHFDPKLEGDQDIDWRIHIQLMPRNDPVVHIRSSEDRRGGQLSGAVGNLLNLNSSH